MQAIMDFFKRVELWLDRHRPKFLRISAVMSVGMLGVVTYAFLFKYAPLQYKYAEMGKPD